MTTDIERIGSELYDALGAVARAAATADDLLAALEAGAPLEDLAGAVIAARHQVQRAHAAAATMRQRYDGVFS